MKNNKYYLQLEDEILAEENRDFKDEELVLNSLDNPRLFELFVDKYKDSFLRTAKRVLKNKNESEDAVQEAFVKIYYNASKFQKRPGVAFKSWAFKILINCVFTKYRKLKRSFGNSEYLDEILYTALEPKDSDFKKREKKDEIESVLRKMPEELSSLIKEHYIEDKPYVEISSARQMSIPALKMKLFRARKKFKEVMSNM